MHGLIRRAALRRHRTRYESGQLGRAERLRQVVVRSAIGGVRALGGLIAGGHEDDRGPIEAPVGAQPATQRIPVDVGHHHVDQEGVRDRILARSECRDPAGSFSDGKSRAGQRQADEQSQVGLIVDDQNSDWRAQFPSSSDMARPECPPSFLDYRRIPEPRTRARPGVGLAYGILPDRLGPVQAVADVGGPRWNRRHPP